MRPLFGFVLAGLLSTALLAVPLPVRADQSSAGTKLAVIDFQAVIRDADATLAVERQIESPYRRDITDRQDALRREERDLAGQRAVLSKEEFDNLARDFQRRMQTTRREIRIRRAQLDQTMAEARSRIQQALVTVVQEIAAERDLDVVLHKSDVVIIRNELDISEEALSRLNDRLPDLEVDIPEKPE